MKTLKVSIRPVENGYVGAVGCDRIPGQIPEHEVVGTHAMSFKSELMQRIERLVDIELGLVPRGGE